MEGSRLRWILFGLFLGAVLLWARSRHGARTNPDRNHASASAAAGKRGTSPFPLAVGNRWCYKAKFAMTQGGPLETTKICVIVSGEERRGFRVVQEHEGRMTGSYIAWADAKGLQRLEFESSEVADLVYPPALTVGQTWEVSRLRRAKVNREIAKRYGNGELNCLEVEYERYYDEKWTRQPGWRSDGLYYVCPGIGLVGMDLRRMVRPPDMQQPDSREVWGDSAPTWELQSYELK